MDELMRRAGAAYLSLTRHLEDAALETCEFE
jgi:hypothetical protein